MTEKTQESLVLLGGTGRFGRDVLPRLHREGYHLVVLSRLAVSHTPFDHPHVTVKSGSLDDAEIIDSLLADSRARSGRWAHRANLRDRRRAPICQGRRLCHRKNGGRQFRSENPASVEPETVDVHVLRPRFIDMKNGQDHPADLAQEIVDAVQRLR